MVSIKHAADLLDCSTDFISDHIASGTINSAKLKSPRGEVKRKRVRIPISELQKIVDLVPGMNSLVENAIKDW